MSDSGHIGDSSGADFGADQPQVPASAAHPPIGHGLHPAGAADHQNVVEQTMLLALISSGNMSDTPARSSSSTTEAVSSPLSPAVIGEGGAGTISASVSSSMMLSGKSATFRHYALERRADSVNQPTRSKPLFLRIMLPEKSPTFRHYAVEHPPIRLNQPDREAAAQPIDSGAISDRPDVTIRGTSALEAEMTEVQTGLNVRSTLLLKHENRAEAASHFPLSRTMIAPWWRGSADRLGLTLLTIASIGPGLWAMPQADLTEARLIAQAKWLMAPLSVQAEATVSAPGGALLNALSIGLAGGAYDAPNWLWRLPSALGVLIAILAIYSIGRRLFSANAGLSAGVLSAICPLIIWNGQIASGAGLGFGFAMLALAALARIYTVQGDGRTPYATTLFWTALGLAVLCAGPYPALWMLGIVVISSVLDRSTATLARLAPLAGVIWLVLLQVPWAVLVLWQGSPWSLSAGGLFDWPDMIVASPLGKTVSLWTVTVYSFVAFLPLFAYAPAALPFIVRHSRRRDMRILAAAWAPLALVSVLFPRIDLGGGLMIGASAALFLGTALVHLDGTKQQSTGHWVRWALSLPAVLAVAFAFLANLTYVLLEGHADLWALAATIGVIVLSSASLWFGARKGRVGWCFVLAACAFAKANGLIFFILLPSAAHLWSVPH